MSQPFVSIYNYLTAAQIADVQAGTETMDLTAALNTAFNSGNFIDAPSGTYRHDGQLSMPDVRMFALRGDGPGTVFKSGQYYWPAGGQPPVGGAVPIEIAAGVNIVDIEGGRVLNDNPGNPYVRCLGARPARFNCNGLTPARIPQTNLPGDRVAHLWENSIGVRAPTAYMVAAFDLAGPLSGKAQIQIAKNDVLRYIFGTDATNATGTGDANENFEMWATKDDGSLFQMFKWYRGSKSWYFYDTMMLGGTAGNLGFYGKAPIAKQTGTPANAIDLATTITLVNSIKARLIAMGLIS